MKGFYSVLAAALLMGSMWLSMLPKDADGVSLPPSSNVSKPSTDSENVSKCTNPNCTCENCKCDPCECPCDVEPKELPRCNNMFCRVCYPEKQLPVVHKSGYYAAYNAYQDRGKPIAVMITAEWCGPCRQWKPEFQALSREFEDASIVVIDRDQEPELAKQLAKSDDGEYGVPYFVGFRKINGKDERWIMGGVPGVRDFLLDKPVIRSQPFYSEPTYRVQRPARTGWFRNRAVRTCGPGGCQ